MIRLGFNENFVKNGAIGPTGEKCRKFVTPVTAFAAALGVQCLFDAGLGPP
jgi:hypothetical protein